MARLMDLPDSKGRYKFEYRDSSKTDVAETFRRAREALEAEAKADQAKVTSIKRRSKK